jgi:hypothetical protein
LLQIEVQRQDIIRTQYAQTAAVVGYNTDMYRAQADAQIAISMWNFFVSLIRN